MGLYDDFRQYFVPEEEDHEDLAIEGNMFFKVDEADIVAAEKRMGVRFPEALRAFYREIGSGQLKCSAAEPGVEVGYCANFVTYPTEVARLYLKEHEHWAPSHDDLADHMASGSDDPPPTHRDLADDGEVPFFEIDERDYLVFRPASDQPDAVRFARGGNIVAADFREFMTRLHEDPRYFLELEE